MTKCFVYLRVSGPSQIRGDGFRRQFIACREYAAANNLKIVRIFKERGVSGTKELDDRPALSALFVALDENGVKTILIEKLDRLARDLMVSETIVKDIKKSEYDLISTCEPNLLSDDPSRNFMRVIFTALAQLEKELLVLKLKGARDRIKIHGRSPGQKNYSSDPHLNRNSEGRKPYGQKPGEQEVLDRMRHMREVDGMRYEVIAYVLNEEGVPTRMGKKWKGPTIQKILSRKPTKAVSA